MSLRCLDLEAPRTYVIAASIGAVFVTFEVVFVGAGLLTVRRLKQQKSIVDSTRAMQLQLTRLLTVQVSNTDPRRGRASLGSGGCIK